MPRGIPKLNESQLERVRRTYRKLYDARRDWKALQIEFELPRCRLSAIARGPYRPRREVR